MTGPDNESDSPWASDDVPIPPEAAPIVWDVATAGPDQSAGAPRVVGPTDPVARPEKPDDGPTSSAPRWRWPAAILVAASMLAAAAVWQSTDDSIDGAADVETATTDVDPDEIDPPEPAPTIVGQPSPETDAGAADVGTIAGGVLELPAAVAAIEAPTEIVVQTADDLIHTLSLPSGRVRTVGSPEDAATGPNEFGPGMVSIVASPSATLLGGYNDDLVVAPREGRPVVVDAADFGLDDPPFGPRISPIGWMSTPDGTGLFLVTTYDVEAGVEREYTVDVTGAVAPSPGQISATSESRVEARGHHIVNDAGGAYLLENDGTATRISSGTAVAASETQILLRECDDERQCQYALQSIGGDERIPTGILPPEVVAGAYGLSLSPDGTAVSYTTYGLTNERVIVDLVDGPVATTPSSDYATTGAWAPDGSGEFVAAEDGNGTAGLVFLDRASGEGVPFGEELGQVVGLAVRYPERELEPSTFVEPTPIEFATADDALTELRLVAYSGLGEMMLVDLDAGTTAVWPTEPLPGPDDSQLFADGDRVGAYTNSSSGRGFISEFGAIDATLTEDQIPVGPLYPGPDGNVWARNTAGENAEDVDYALVNLNGNPHLGGSPPEDTVRQISVRDGTVLGGDGRGGLVFESGGDLYTSAGGGVDRLTSGELLAIGPTTALVRECDERLNCTALVVDRATGERTDSGLDPLAVATGASTDRSVSLIGSMSPDGTVALVNFVSTGTAGDPPETVEKWFFFDLETGNPIGAEHPDDVQPIIWNADSTYAAYVADRNVVVYERATGNFITVPDTEGTRSLTAVDPAFS